MEEKCLGIFILILFNFNCYSQQVLKNQSVQNTQYFAPCFISEVPMVINLPDSFQFKEKNYSAFIHVTIYFDTLGNALDVLPQQLYVKNKVSNKLEKKYSYWKGWEDSSIDMTKEEAMRFAHWAQKVLPLVAKLKRYPPNIKCTEKITNRIARVLEFRLE